MNVELLIPVVNTVIFAGIFVYMFLLDRSLKKKLGEIPEMWKYFTIGFLFMTFFSFIHIFEVFYKQNAYFLTFYAQTMVLVGITLILTGFIKMFESKKSK